MQKFRFGLIVLFGLWALSGQVGYASCAPRPTPAEEFEHSHAVFVGEVTGMSQSNPLSDFFGWGYAVTFNVTEAWKGVDQKTVTLKGQARTSNEFRFEQGQHYLVYAYHEGNNAQGPLTTNGCKRTTLLADAQEDLHMLGPGVVLEDAGAAAPTGVPLLLMMACGLLLLACLALLVLVRRRRT